MTLSTTTQRMEYTGNGALATYPYNFKILVNTDLQVYVGGALKTLTTDYTVTGVGVSGGGNVVFEATAIPGNGSSIVILRSVPKTQETDLAEGSKLPAETLEQTLDKLTMITQDVQEQLSRRVKTASSDATLLDNLSLPTPGAGQYLKWNAAGTGLECLPLPLVNQTLVPGVAPWVNVVDYGAVGDDVTSDSVAFANATAAAMVLGVPLVIPAGTYYLPDQWVIPNDAGAPLPLQKPLKIIGAGADTDCGTVRYVPSGGTILRMTYAAGPKMTTLGCGRLEIEGISFYNDHNDTQPFIYDTNTVLNIHNCSFWGNTTSRNDGIWTGGNTAPADGFQGYGTVIRECYFQKISRAWWNRSWGNGIVFRDNVIWSGSGGTAAVVLDVAASGTGQTGCVVTGNIVECVLYTYGIEVLGAQQNYFGANGFYDGVPGNACYRFASEAYFNTVIESFSPGNMVFVQDDNPINAGNVVIRNQQTRNTEMGRFNPVNFRNLINIFGGTNFLRLFQGEDTSSWFVSPQVLNSGSTRIFWLTFNKEQNGASFVGLKLTSYPDLGTWVNGTIDLTCPAPTQFRIAAAAGANLKIGGDTLWLGDSSWASASYHAAGNFQVNKCYLHQSMPVANTDSATLDATLSNVFEISNPNPTNLATINGVKAGQIIHLHFTNGNTTVVAGGGIRLAGGANFVGTQYDTLTLMRDSGNGYWVEIARSVNA